MKNVVGIVLACVFENDDGSIRQRGDLIGCRVQNCTRIGIEPFLDETDFRSRFPLFKQQLLQMSRNRLQRQFRVSSSMTVDELHPPPLKAVFQRLQQ